MDEFEISCSVAEIGRHLMQVRDRAGLKQGELAKRVSLSPAVLSRIESGERTISSSEALDILAQIDTPEANKLAIAIQRIWNILPRPPLDHPDQDMLWEAEQAAEHLVVAQNQPDTPRAFERRLSEYVEELKRCAGLLLKRDHQVAFIGSIGVGKSTAICRMIGLEYMKEDGTLAPVLEVGGGGITVCEVHIRTGPEYGLLIDARSDEEIRQDVGDFVDHILKGNAQDEDGASESQGISKEIERALRNMAGLGVQRLKGADGKRIVKDPARDLAIIYPTRRELMLEMLSRMELHRRDCRDIWYDSASGKSPKVWLKDTFAAINNGRHPQVTLPKRIEVVVSERLLKNSDLTVRFIDTKGIDRTAAREDIEIHLDDQHTLAILCSPFNNVPSAEARLLLERAKEAGVRDLNVNVALLVLARPSEAMAMKDDVTSTHVESSEEGYDLKEEQARMALEPVGLQNLPIGFYNAHEDSAEHACNFLAERLTCARTAFRERTQRAIQGARGVLKNRDEEHFRAVLSDASETLHTWLRENVSVPDVNARVQESLMSQIQIAYAATVRASVGREGEWTHLSYSHHIGYGARRLAVLALEKSVDQFTGHCKLLVATPSYSEATELILQTERVLVESYKELLRKTQLMGQTIFRDALKVDSAFWQACIYEWGKGPGYKGRIVEHNRNWFDSESHRKLQDELKVLISREWANTLQSVAELIEPAN